MFGPLGVPELIFIFVLALLIFGPRKLPEIGRTIGKGLSEFRKASTDLKRSINAEAIEEEMRQSDPRKILRDDLSAPAATDHRDGGKGDGGNGGGAMRPGATGKDQATAAGDETPGGASPRGGVPRSGAAAEEAPSVETSDGHSDADDTSPLVGASDSSPVDPEAP